MSDAERRILVQCAIGRIFAMGSRPEQPGDGAEYEHCRAVILDAYEAERGELPRGYTPNYARDRNKGTFPSNDN